MKTRWTTLVVAGATILGLSGLVMAGPGGGPGFGRGPAHGAGPGMIAHGPGPMGQGLGGMLGLGAAQLNLTDEQRQAIFTICQESRADANEVVAAVEDARAALHEAVTTGANEAEIRAAAATLGTAIGNQAVLRSQTIAAVKAVLTEEQRKQYEEIRASVPHARQGMGMGGPGFGGRQGFAGACPADGWGAQAGRANRFSGPGRGPAHSVAPDCPLGAPQAGVEQMFSTADTNKDGVLTMDELKAFHGTARGGRGLGRQQ